jgi:hypothetical protein
MTRMAESFLTTYGHWLSLIPIWYKIFPTEHTEYTEESDIKEALIRLPATRYPLLTTVLLPKVMK